MDYHSDLVLPGMVREFTLPRHGRRGLPSAGVAAAASRPGPAAAGRGTRHPLARLRCVGGKGRRAAAITEVAGW